MKNKQIFSLKLYFESLNRLKMPGIIFGIILLLEAILVPTFYVINDTYAITDASYELVPSSISAIEAHPLLFLIILASPIFTFTAFSFLNKRNSSDFYHSLPHTRLSLFTSITGAILTWLFAISAVTTAVSRLLLAIFPSHFSVIEGTYLPFFITCFVSAMLLCAVISVAMSITGTILNNVVLTGLILYLPRFVILFITQGLLVKFPLMVEAYLSDFLTLNINTVTGITGYVFGITYDLEKCFEAGPQIYTAVLALVYFILAAVLFCRRKSESAERSAPSRFMQAVYRITVASVICVPICYALFTDALTFTYDSFAIFVLYLIVVLVYLLYELITTKKWKNLLRCLPGLGIVALINVLLITVMGIVTTTEQSFSPEAGEIEYVQVLDEYGYSDYLGNGIFSSYDRYVEFPQYAESLSSEVKLDDPKVLEIVSTSLKNTLSYVDRHGSIHGNYYYDDDYKEYLGIDKVEQYEIYTLKIKTANSTKYRRIRIEAENCDYIMKCLSKSPDYSKAWLTLPDPQRDTITVNYSQKYLTGEGAGTVFRTMQEELKTVDFKAWHDYLVNYEQNIATISYSTNGFEFYVNFSPAILPKTTEAFLKATADTTNITPIELKEKLAGSTDKYISLEYACLWECSKDGTYTPIYLNTYMSDSSKKDIASLLKDGEAKVGETFIQIDVSEILSTKLDERGGIYAQEYEDYSIFCPVVDDYAEILEKYING